MRFWVLGILKPLIIENNRNVVCINFSFWTLQIVIFLLHWHLELLKYEVQMGVKLELPSENRTAVNLFCVQGQSIALDSLFYSTEQGCGHSYRIFTDREWCLQNLQWCVDLYRLLVGVFDINKVKVRDKLGLVKLADLFVRPTLISIKLGVVWWKRPFKALQTRLLEQHKTIKN